MNIAAQLPPRNHNGPPDPIEAVIAEYDAVISEVQNWTDGEPVTDRAGMDAVDALLKEFKAYKSALTRAGKERTDPFHKAWKAEVAAVKVYTDDADRIQKALVATVAPFKAKLAAEQEAARKAEWAKAEAARREAEEKAAAASAADLEAQREIAEAKQAAIDAEKMAKAQEKQAVKGMRTVTYYEVTSSSDLLRWVNKNDRQALDDFCADYARRVHKDGVARPGLRVWTEKEAF